MKRIALIVLLLSSSTAFAQVTVPHQMSLQSVIYGSDGKVTTSERVDLTIRVLDDANNVLFTETHSQVPVVEGTVSLNVGSLTPIPVEALDPTTGAKFVDVQVDGSTPFELLPLGAVPYAVWAEKALTVPDSSIESRHIQDGTIQLVDLAPGIAFTDIEGQATDTQIPGTIARSTDVTSHISAATAHPASAITLTGPFLHFVAANVQEAIQKIDEKLTDEVVNRREGQTNITTDLGTANTNIGTLQTLTSDINNFAGTLSGAHIDSINMVPGTLDEAKVNSDLTRDSEVVSIINGPTTSLNAISETKIDSAITRDVEADQNYVNATGDTMAGELTVPSLQVNENIGITGTVDGVDVGDLNSTVNSHASAASAHDSDGNVVGVNTLDAAVSSLQGSIATANANITTLQGITDDINDIPGILDESKIDEDIARESDISVIGDQFFTTSSEVSTIADTQIDVALQDGSIPNTAAEIGAAEAGHAHDFSAITGQVTASQIPFSLQPAAFGSIGPANAGCPVTNSMNIASATPVSSGCLFNHPGCRINFTGRINGSTYIAMVTDSSGNNLNTGNPTVCGKDIFGFTASPGAAENSMDVLIFGIFIPGNV